MTRSAVLLAFMAALLLAPPAQADRVYWGNEEAGTLSFADLEGGNGGDLAIAGGMVDNPQGLALDSAANRIYWTNYGGLLEGIYSANLDGTGGGPINTTGATVNSAYGLAIDPLGGRVYWGNAPAGTDDISYARLDGSGGGNLNTAGASELDNPLGVAVDPGAGRIYFPSLSDVISFARLDESGGGDINTTGATVSNPVGIAVDSAAGRVYWSNGTADAISFADLDGSGGGDINTAGATLSNAAGVAIDPEAGRIYWANSPVGISYARLDGSGGGDLDVSGASPGEASFPILHRSPSGAGPPAIAVSPTRGSRLSCSEGSWAPDLLGSFLYRAPRSFTYSWSRDGAAVDGATDSTLSPAAVGEYRCTVTASNGAGSSAQTSAARAIETASIRGLRISPNAFRAARGGPSVLASAGGKRKKPGARVRFRLNEGATVVFRVSRERRGRKPKKLRGRLRRVGTAGLNGFRFTGRLRGRRLKPGRYLLAATPKGVGKAGKTRRAKFRVR
jgi:hypothetical protein